MSQFSQHYESALVSIVSLNISNYVLHAIMSAVFKSIYLGSPILLKIMLVLNSGQEEIMFPLKLQIQTVKTLLMLMV